MGVVGSLEEINTDEDGPAVVFHCRSGKGRTTTAMAIASLIICHKRASFTSRFCGRGQEREPLSQLTGGYNVGFGLFRCWVTDLSLCAPRNSLGWA